MKYHKNEKGTLNYLILKLKLNHLNKKELKDKMSKYIIMKTIPQKKNVDIVYMPRLPKSLLTPNPKSAYGRTNIRRQFKLRGGKKERTNVLNEARKQGYSGNRLDSAYRYLADVSDVMLGFERKDYRDKKRSKDRIQSQVQQFIGKQIDDMDIGIANKDELIELINGLTVNAPAFIKQGDIIKINTETLEYMERVKL